MVKITQDLLDSFGKKQNNKFPTHGWGNISQENKILWLPIIRLVRDTELVRKQFGATQPLKPRKSHDVLPFCETLRKLAVALRELHSFRRELSVIRLPPKDNSGYALIFKINEMVPIYIDVAYIYLLRIADRLCAACRLVLFKKYGHVPDLDYGNFIKFVANDSSIRNAFPFVDYKRIQSVFANHSLWYTLLLRRLRDNMEHRLVRTIIDVQQAGDASPYIDARLYASSNDVDLKRELISTLPNIIEGLCSLFTEVCRLLEWKSTYGRGDYLYLIGTDDDVTGFWPKI